MDEKRFKEKVREEMRQKKWRKTSLALQTSGSYETDSFFLRKKS